MIMCKCFGGSLDQKRIDVDAKLHIGDAWKTVQLAEFPVLGSWFDDMLDKPVNIRYEYYIMEQFRTANITVRFLRHDQLSMDTLALKIFG